MSTQYAPAMAAPILVPKGLPDHLPAGERLLWQGAPDWRAMARDVFHIRGLALYFAVIVAWCVATNIMDDAAPMQFALSTAQLIGAALGPLALVVLYSWMVSRTTTYTITDARVVIQLGMALPITINMPYQKIETAAMKVGHGGFGDISLLLAGPDRLAYLILWPHARPWRMKNAEPTLRAIPDVARVGQLIARALAASADMPVPVLDIQTVPQDKPLTVPA